MCALVAAEFAMAAQLCDLNAEGEAVFDVKNVREFTRRATATEVRNYMRQLRARNAFLHGIDAIAEICVASTLPEDLWMKDRLRESQKAKRLRGREVNSWDSDRWDREEIDVNPELYHAIMDAACHWRGGCRNAGFSMELAKRLAFEELKLMKKADDRKSAVLKTAISRECMRYTNLDDACRSQGIEGEGRALVHAKAASASLAPRYLCLFAHIADQMREDRMRFKALQGLRLSLDLPGSKRVKQLQQKHAESGRLAA